MHWSAQYEIVLRRIVLVSSTFNAIKIIEKAVATN
jgi:hypothetical protein